MLVDKPQSHKYELFGYIRTTIIYKSQVDGPA
jgi:hypothetical protein